MSDHTFCTECGWDVPVDEDGCCQACGATATGAAVDVAARERAEWGAENARLRTEVTDAYAQYKKISDDDDATIAALEADNARLRAAVGFAESRTAELENYIRQFTDGPEAPHE